MMDGQEGNRFHIPPDAGMRTTLLASACVGFCLTIEYAITAIDTSMYSSLDAVFHLPMASTFQIGSYITDATL